MPLSFGEIGKAVRDLYGGWEKMLENAQKMIREILCIENLEALYQSYANEEAVAKDALITYDEKDLDVLQEDNLDDILGRLMEM